MKRSVRIAALALAMVMVFSCLCAGASDKAAKMNLTLAVYKGFPSVVTLNADDESEIKQVVRMQFRYSGTDSFSSIEKFIKNFSGVTLSNNGVNWVSSNKKVACVASGGAIAGKKKGTAYVYPVPKGVKTYKYFGRYIIYLKVSVQNGVKLYGGIGTKVKVLK